MVHGAFWKTWMEQLMFSISKEVRGGIYGIFKSSGGLMLFVDVEERIPQRSQNFIGRLE